MITEVQQSGFSFVTISEFLYFIKCQKKAISVLFISHRPTCSLNIGIHVEKKNISSPLIVTLGAAEEFPCY